MKTIVIDGWRIEYESKPSAVVAYVPFGFVLTERRIMIAREKFGRDVVFKNARPKDSQTEKLYLDDGSSVFVRYTDDSEIRRARDIVNGFLTKTGVAPAFSNTAPIEIVHGEHEWLMVGLQHDLPTTPSDRIKITEGYTTRQREDAGEEQSARVYINGAHHTIGAIVHEIFHTLSAKILSQVWGGAGPNLEEAMTEYFTCVATGLFQRLDIDGSSLYSTGLRILRNGIKTGAIDDDDLRTAYFAGDPTAIEKIRAYFDPIYNS